MITSTRSNTYGGNGGVPFDDSHVIEEWGPIRQIVVRHGSEVDSIGVFWPNGKYLNHGGTGGTETVINLDSTEFITRVDGRSGDRLDQITFRSNKMSYGPFGGGGGRPFTVDFSGGALQYLFGRSGSEIDQIGFAYGGQPAALPITIVRSDTHGGTGGNPFDDLNAAGDLLGKITSITVRHGSVVDNIAVSYEGQPGSNPHGGGGGFSDTFTLGDNEWVTEIHGHGGSLLDQIQFFLNSGRVSPAYGGNGGTAFVEKRDNSAVKAFFGRSGSQVDQLGFYFVSLLQPPEWPSYRGVSQLVGTSPSGRVTVWVDPSLGSQVLQNGWDLMNDADRIVRANDGYFGRQCGNVDVIVFALRGVTDGTGGGEHLLHGSAIEVDASFGSSNRVSALLEAEYSENCMIGTLSGRSTGEALSRWCAMAVSQNALSDYETGTSWDQAGRLNYVDTTDPTDTNRISTGCGMVFLSWLLSQGYHLAKIAPAMVSLGDAGTLAGLYTSLTGKTTAWNDFTTALAGIGTITGDDPFGGLPMA